MRTRRIKEIEINSKPGSEGLGDLEKEMKHWIRFHTFTLMAALVHRLNLPQDIQRAETHLLRLRIRRLSNNDKPSSNKWQTLFSIEEIAVLEQSKAKFLGSVWESGLDQLSDMRARNVAAGRGRVGVIAIQCEPLAVYFAPIGSLKNLESVRVLHGRWKGNLVKLVSGGRRFVSFETFDSMTQ